MHFVSDHDNFVFTVVFITDTAWCTVSSNTNLVVIVRILMKSGGAGKRAFLAYNALFKDLYLVSFCMDLIFTLYETQDLFLLYFQAACLYLLFTEKHCGSKR